MKRPPITRRSFFVIMASKPRHWLSGEHIVFNFKSKSIKTRKEKAMQNQKIIGSEDIRRKTQNFKDVWDCLSAREENPPTRQNNPQF